MLFSERYISHKPRDRQYITSVTSALSGHLNSTASENIPCSIKTSESPGEIVCLYAGTMNGIISLVGPGSYLARSYCSSAGEKDSAIQSSHGLSLLLLSRGPRRSHILTGSCGLIANTKPSVPAKIIAITNKERGVDSSKIREDRMK